MDDDELEFMRMMDMWGLVFLCTTLSLIGVVAGAIWFLLR